MQYLVSASGRSRNLWLLSAVDMGNRLPLELQTPMLHLAGADVMSASVNTAISIAAHVQAMTTGPADGVIPTCVPMLVPSGSKRRNSRGGRSRWSSPYRRRSDCADSHTYRWQQGEN